MSLGMVRDLTLPGKSVRIELNCSTPNHRELPAGSHRETRTHLVTRSVRVFFVKVKGKPQEEKVSGFASTEPYNSVD